MSKRKFDDSVEVADTVSREVVDDLKCLLFKRLNEPVNSRNGKPSPEETKMKAILDSCFEEKVSGSLLVVGSAASGKRLFVDKILSSYKTPSGETIKVARLQGLAYTKDNHALISLAKQVGIFAESDNFNMSVEALQSHFQQSRLQSIPTVILIEDIDEFTKGNRQVLLYTLLDLMHKKDLFFVVVGLTHRIDITSLLEKRVISRLSAQCIYLRPKTAQEIKEILLDKLALETTCDSGVPGREVGLSGVHQYKERFSASLMALLSSKEGSKCDLIMQHVAWGQDVIFFLTVLKLAVSRLSPGHPFITHASLSECFSQMALPDMESVISSLSMIELYLLVAAIRLHIRHGAMSPDADPVLHKDGYRVLKSKGMVGFNVEQLLEEAEKLTGLVRKKIVMKRQLLSAVSTLTQNAKLILLSNGKQFQFAKSGSACQVLEESTVQLNRSLVEFQATFRSRTLHISDKLRKAVLDPLDPLTYGGVLPSALVGGQSTSVSGMMELV